MYCNNRVGVEIEQVYHCYYSLLFWVTRPSPRSYLSLASLSITWRMTALPWNRLFAQQPQAIPYPEQADEWGASANAKHSSCPQIKGSASNAALPLSITQLLSRVSLIPAFEKINGGNNSINANTKFIHLWIFKNGSASFVKAVLLY